MDDSAVQINFLKESQFYMACKLVAIYQKHITENTLSSLTADKIDQAITTPNRYYANFDLDKFESIKSLVVQNIEEEESKDPQDLSID